MHCKSYSHFFSKTFQHICVSLDVNFNESLTNDVVSLEQLGPVLYLCHFTLQDIGAGLGIVPLLGLVEAIAIGKAFGMFLITVDSCYLDFTYLE